VGSSQLLINYKPTKLNIMRQLIEFLGRLSVVILLTILLETVVSCGHALFIEDYHWCVWIIQALVLIIDLWITLQWYDDDMKKLSH
jgi:hypothetical protein